MFPYFSKFFTFYSLGEVEYVKCSYCGLVVSKTHFQMPEAKWQELNEKYHCGFFGTNTNMDDQKWIQRLENQRDAIKKLSKLKIISKVEPWVDWGCGDGKLSNLLRKDCNIVLLNYDKYFGKTKGYLSEKNIKTKKFSFVITTSVFEHLRSIEPLEEINSLVAPDGILATHTMVMEQIPCNPEWHYLLPVHCTFYTNKSMQILFDKWKYKASLYHPKSRLWFYFKNDNQIKKALPVINNQVKDKEDIFYYKKGFMDYWQ
jgi:Methyltransferase domain